MTTARPNTSAPGADGAARAQLAGIGLLMVACLCFSVLDASAKYLSQTLPPVQIVWVRFAVHVGLVAVLFQLWRSPSVLKTKRPLLQLMRALFMLATTVCNFFAVKYLQLAETISILFAAPFIVTALAGPLLGEWAGIRRWAAIIVGFIGVLIVTQPGLGGMHWAAIYSVGAMIAYAFYALTTRMLATTDSPTGMLFFSGLAGAVAMTPAGLSAWVPPTGYLEWTLLMMTGVMGAVGHWFFILAHRLAPAPLLSPFIYSQIVWMVALGYFAFADIPTWSTVVGASVVVASGLYILYREQIRSAR